MASSSRYPPQHSVTTPSLFYERGQQLRLSTPVSPVSTYASPSSRQPWYRQDAYDLNSHVVSPIMSRSPSVAGSDRYSVISGLTSNTYLPGNPQNVNPPPSYVAPFGAAQVVNDHKSPGRRRISSDEEDARTSRSRNVQFTVPALELVNNFLDQLLYSILSAARSTNLAALRSAVIEVLKARLARDAIASAEEELHELLAGGEEEEEENTQKNAAERNRSWDLELVWKRTRLRVMVYMRLGEMEDDDEEQYIKEEELFHGTERRFSQTSGLVSWASAIFLTGVLEYVAEQTLQVAGQAAYTRARRQSRSNARAGTPTLEEERQKPVTVDDYDVEKVALNSTLGRLWRTWRKSLRMTAAAPPTDTHHYSRLTGSDNFLSNMRRGSSANDTRSPQMRLDEVPEMQFPEHVLASNIPLPMGHPQRDVDEIEVPGLARDPDVDEEAIGDVKTPTARRNSFTHLLGYTTTGGLPTPASSSPTEQPTSSERPVYNRQRSMSVPTPARTPVTGDDLLRLHTPGAYPATPAAEKSQPFDEASGEEQVNGTHAGTSAAENVPRSVEDESGNHTSEAYPAVLPTGNLPSSEKELQDDHIPAATSESTPLGQEQPLTEPHHEEQKANAKEMAPHRRPSQSVKDLLDKVVNHEPADENAEQHEKSEHHGLIAGAVAGATAAAAGVAAMVYGSKDGQKEGSESEKSVGDSRDVEELDRRKSLFDMKTMLGSGSGSGSGQAADEEHEVPQILHTRQVSLTQPATPPMMVSTGSEQATMNRSLAEHPTMNRTGSEQSQHSVELKDPYSLGSINGPGLSHQSSAMIREEPRNEENNIGVAKTSEARVASPIPTPDEQDARSLGQRPSRLILGGSAPIHATDTQGFLENRSLTATPELEGSSVNSRRPSPNDEAMRGGPVKASAKRRSIPGAALSSAATTPVVEQNPHRQSWSAALQQQREQQDGSPSQPDVPAMPAVPFVPAVHQQGTTPPPPMREHPALRMMAEARRKSTEQGEPPVAIGPHSSVLPSASIRGPEDFSMFVQDNETQKYSRTAGAARDGIEEATRTSRSPPRQMMPVELSSVPSFSRARPVGPPLDTGETRQGRSIVPKQATSAIPDPPPERVPEPLKEPERKLEHRKSISRPPQRNTSTHRKSGLMAREPQIQTESTRDFADWIRSTGPTKEQEVRPVINPANRSTTSLHSVRSMQNFGGLGTRPSRSSSLVSQEPKQERTKSLTQATMYRENIPPVPTVPNRTSQDKRSMQGRSPHMGDSESFAPYRSTMDPSQLKDMGDRINGNRPLDLRLNTNVGSATSLPSARSQTSLALPPANRHPANTRAGALLASNANSTVHPAYANGHSVLSSVENEATPQRKRHRNKDPYALDSDNDSDHLTALPRNKRQEESLADFLNNNEPPTDNAPRAIVTRGAVPQKSALNKSRASSIASQRSANPNGADAARTKSLLNNASSPRPSSSGARSFQSTPGNRPYSQVSAGAPPMPVSNRPKMEARTPGDSSAKSITGARAPSRSSFSKKNNSTKDLADFLKNSGPEDDDKSAPAPIVGRQSKLSPKDAEKARKKAERDSLKVQTTESKKKIGFFQRLMGGRKKTWLDMP